MMDNRFSLSVLQVFVIIYLLPVILQSFGSGYANYTVLLVSITAIIPIPLYLGSNLI